MTQTLLKSRNVMIRNIPEELHRKFKTTTFLAGKSMSEVLISAMRTYVREPSSPDQGGEGQLE